MRFVGLAGLCLVGLAVCAEETPFLNAVSLGYGRAQNDIDIYRLGIRKDSSWSWLENRTGWLSVYYEASLNVWSKGSEQVYGGAISPVFIYYFGDKGNSFHPYVEAGIGAACISDSNIDGRQLSTLFQFEDRVGAGVRFERADVSVRYMHYSNGSIAEPNQGLDIFIVTLSYRM